MVFRGASVDFGLTVERGNRHTSTPFVLKAGEALSLHVFVDGGLVEVVANNRASLACSTPWGPVADGVWVVGDTGVTAFDGWALEGIW